MWKCSPKISFTNQSTCLHFYWPMISLCALVCQAKGCPHYTAKLVLIIHLPYFNLTYHYKGGGSFGPQSYFQLIWTQWTIIDKFIIKGVHKWSCRIFFEGTWKIARVTAIFLNAKNIAKFRRNKISIFFFTIKMTIVSQFLSYWGVDFCKHPNLYSRIL